MKRNKILSILGIALLLGGLLHPLSANSADEGFYGKAKSYFIDTTKMSGSVTNVDASALAMGGQFGYKKEVLKGLMFAVTVMGTYGVGNSNILTEVDTSVLSGSYNGFDPITVLGEAYMKYDFKKNSVKIGRQILNTPLLAAKEVRMLPTTFEALTYTVNDLPDTSIMAGYISAIKQRNSDTFYSMGRNAFGNNINTITGKNDTGVALLSVTYNGWKDITLQIWDYYASEILNAYYLQGDIKGAFSKNVTWNAAVQYLTEKSVGGMDNYLNSTGVSGIDASLTGMKVGVSSGDLSLGLAMTKTGKNASAHDAIVAPWDGTPAFTNTITGNNLEKSQYGAALGADGPYTADTTSYRAEVKYALFTNLKMMLAYAVFDQNKVGTVPQKDINLKLSYAFAGKLKGLSLTGIGIWVNANSGVVNKTLDQYRLIMAYPF